MQVLVTPTPRVDSTDPAPVLSSAPATKPRTLTDAVVDAIRVRHYSRKTEQAYVHWVRRFVFWSGRRHPRDLGAPEVEAFLTSLAVDGCVSESTQRQALSALLFLYRHVLEMDLPWLNGLVRAKPSVHVPEVLSRDEVRALFGCLKGERGLILKLLYGSGLRLGEALHLRVKDLDLQRLQLTVRDGKGGKDRTTTLPQSLVPQLQWILDRRLRWHHVDLATGHADVEMPNALARKYPRAASSWPWQFVFATDTYADFAMGRPGCRGAGRCGGGALEPQPVERMLRVHADHADAADHLRWEHRAGGGFASSAWTPGRCEHCGTVGGLTFDPDSLRVHAPLGGGFAGLDDPARTVPDLADAGGATLGAGRDLQRRSGVRALDEHQDKEAGDQHGVQVSGCHGLALSGG